MKDTGWVGLLLQRESANSVVICYLLLLEIVCCTEYQCHLEAMMITISSYHISHRFPPPWPPSSIAIRITPSDASHRSPWAHIQTFNPTKSSAKSIQCSPLPRPSIPHSVTGQPSQHRHTPLSTSCQTPSTFQINKMAVSSTITIAIAICGEVRSGTQTQLSFPESKETDSATKRAEPNKEKREAKKWAESTLWGWGGRGE